MGNHGRYIDIIPAIEIDINYSKYISSINKKKVSDIEIGSNRQLIWHEIAHYTSLTTTTYGIALTTAANIRLEYFLLLLKQIEHEKQIHRFEGKPLIKSFSSFDKDTHLSPKLKNYIRSYLEINNKYSNLISDTPINNCNTYHDEKRLMRAVAQNLPVDSEIERIGLNFEISDPNERLRRATLELIMKEDLQKHKDTGQYKTAQRMFYIDPYDLIQNYGDANRPSYLHISPKSVLEGYARWADTYTLCRYDSENIRWEQNLLDLFLNNSARNQNYYAFYGAEYGDAIRCIFSVLKDSYSNKDIINLIPYLLELSFCYFDDQITVPAKLENFGPKKSIDTESLLPISSKLQLLLTTLLHSSDKIIQQLNCQNEIHVFDFLTDLNNWRNYSKTQLSPLFLSLMINSESSIQTNFSEGLYSIVGQNHEMQNWQLSSNFISEITMALAAYKKYLFNHNEFYNWFEINNISKIIAEADIPLIVICSNKCYYKDEWFKDRKEKKHILSMIVKDQVHKDLIQSTDTNKSRNLFKSIFGQDESFNCFLKSEFPCYDLIKTRLSLD